MKFFHWYLKKCYSENLRLFVRHNCKNVIFSVIPVVWVNRVKNQRSSILIMKIKNILSVPFYSLVRLRYHVLIQMRYTSALEKLSFVLNWIVISMVLNMAIILTTYKACHRKCMKVSNKPGRDLYNENTLGSYVLNNTTHISNLFLNNHRNITDLW